MDNIKRASEACVLRACFFAGVAIFTTMLGLSFDLVLACKFGAAMTVFWALFMLAWALRLPYARISENQVWIMLEHDQRPPKHQALKLIVPVMQDHLYDYAGKASFFGGSLALCAILLRIWQI